MSYMYLMLDHIILKLSRSLENLTNNMTKTVWLTFYWITVYVHASWSTWY